MVEDNFYSDVPERKSRIEGKLMSNEITLRCTNTDINGVEHNIAYMFAYDHEVLNGFTLTSNEIEDIIGIYFNQFKEYFEAYSYEDYAEKDTFLNIANQMKLHLDTLEKITGVKLFFGLNGVLYEAAEGDDPSYNISFDWREMQRLPFDIDVNNPRP